MLNGAQLHLFTNHIPILGIPFVLALLLYGVWRKRDDVQRISMGALVIIGLLTVPAFLSGEKAEEIMEDQPRISETHIENHEDAAELTFWILEGIAAIALLGLVFFRSPKSIPKWFTTGIVVGLVASGILMARVGHLGGLISHPEIRTDQTNGNTPSGSVDQDDDD